MAPPPPADRRFPTALHVNKMALITSDCGAMRYPTIKWP